jgi:hypothetical protein
LTPPAAAPAQEAPAAEPAAGAEAEAIAMTVSETLAQQLGVDAADVTVVSVEPVDWPDSCLGVSVPDVMCAAVITPGYRVVLEANGEQYEYHTDVTGEQIVLAAAPEPQIGDVLLEWQQTVDTCESLVIGREGLAFGPCMGRLLQGRFVTPERQQEFDDFVANFAPFEADTSAGIVRFAGQGASEATADEQQMIAEWARQVKLEAEGG